MATLSDGEALYRRRHPAPAGEQNEGPDTIVRMMSQPRGLASGEALYRRRSHEHAGRFVIESEPEPTDVTPGGGTAA